MSLSVAIFLSEGAKMKSIHLLFILMLCFLLLSPVTAVAQDLETESDVTGYCRLERDAKLWSGPSKNFKVVREAEAGLLLIIIGEKAGHYRVQVPDGFQCYISADYLEVDADSMGTVTGSRVNLRSIPRIKGDYPIFQAMGGDKLYVWDRVGEWYCVSAPQAAYLYVPKDAVSTVIDSADVQAEIATLQQKGHENWESHIGVLQERLEKEASNQVIQKNLKSLEADADQKFKERDLKETLREYEKIASETEDDKTRSLAEVRADEVKALIAKEDAESELKKREEAWREEKEKLVAALDKTKPIRPQPATHRKAGVGRLVTVVGRVHAHGAEVTLKGGKSSLDTLWNVKSPDGRFILSDFHLRRVSIVGRIGNVTNKDESPLLVVERMEIIN